MTRPRNPPVVRVDLPRWQPAWRTDELNAIRSEFEADGIPLPIHESPEIDDKAR